MEVGSDNDGVKDGAVNEGLREGSKLGDILGARVCGDKVGISTGEVLGLAEYKEISMIVVPFDKLASSEIKSSDSIKITEASRSFTSKFMYRF